MRTRPRTYPPSNGRNFQKHLVPLTIEIRSTKDVLEGFRKTFKALAAGRCVPRHGGVSVASMPVAWSLLTQERLALLRTVRTKHPGSMKELALAVGRDLKGVRSDLRTLEKYGLIRMSPGRRVGKRRVPRPEVPFDEIVLKIAI